MDSFAVYLAEAPTYEKVRKCVVSVATLYMNATATGDVDWTIEQIPTSKIVTRERGKRYPLDKLIAAYKDDPETLIPIGLRKRSDGKYLVLDGHHRLQACKAAGLNKIWAVCFTANFKERESSQLCVCGHTKRYHNGSTMYGWADCITCNDEKKCKTFKRAKPKG